MTCAVLARKPALKFATANIDMLSEVSLGAAHLDDLMALVSEAGWNQIPADWQMMLRQGQGFGILDDNRVVASALALPYGPEFGWISMVLVAGSHRRRGLATTLMNRCIHSLGAKGLTQVLDATSDGFHVYENLGFRPVLEFQRWERQPNGQRATSLTEPSGLPKRILQQDRNLFGADRSLILTDMASRGGPCVYGPEETGFGVSRIGNHALQIGPIVAHDTGTGQEIFDRLNAASTGRTIIDIPKMHGEFSNWVSQRGYHPVRSFTRMIRGTATCPARPEIYAFAGPELG